MPIPSDIALLQIWVVASGLAIGLALGWVAQYARFCTLGAIADWFSMGDTSRLRMWLLAMAVAVITTQALLLAGVIDARSSHYIGSRIFWLSNIAGGLVFGFGMVLASGCGSRTLVRIGGGSLKALVVFVVMALFAYMTMRGIFAVARVASLEKIFISVPGQQDLASLLSPVGAQAGLSAPALRAAVAGLVAVLLLWAVFSSRQFRRQPRLTAGGLVIGLLVTAGWLATGLLGFIAEDPSTLEPRFIATNTRAIESLTFVAPLAYWLELFMLWSDASKIFTFSIAIVSGVALGSLIYSLVTGQFRWEGFRDLNDLTLHLVGAALMGVGGVVAFGCTIGQGISGVSLLATGSILTTLAIMAGAWAGLAWAERRA